MTDIHDEFLPAGFRERMKNMLGNEYKSFIASYAKPRHPSLRINTLKLQGDTNKIASILPFPLESIEWMEDGFRYPDCEEIRPGKHPLHEAGVYYIQEASAMIPASLCPPEPGDRVLDMCAAPGGKATQAAAALNGRGLLVANEIIPSRAAVLSQNIERMGIRNAVVTNESPQSLARRFGPFFNKIIVDAPCSGEGMFRKEEQALTMWSQENVDACAARQREILNEADKMLLPGGYLTYSTCTFAPEENEETVAWFLETHPDYTVEITKNPSVLQALKDGLLDSGHPEWVKKVPLTDSIAVLIQKSIRLFPHHANGEGHFAVLLKKAGEKSEVPLPAKKEKRNSGKGDKGKSTDPADTAMKLFRAFCDETVGAVPDGVPQLFGDMLYLLPDITGSNGSLTDGLHVLRAGLQVGSVKGGRFEPSHSLAMALNADAVKNVFAADGYEAQYLRGEVIPCPDTLKSWCLVTYGGFPLGWGKASGGMVKNHYPKGLRR